MTEQAKLEEIAKGQEPACATCRHLRKWEQPEVEVYEDVEVGPFWRRRTERMLVWKIYAQVDMKCTRMPEWIELYDRQHWCGEYSPAPESSATVSDHIQGHDHD